MGIGDFTLDFKKGATSIEYLFISGIAIGALAIIMMIGTSMGNDSIRVAQAKDTVETLAKSADYVYSLGPGTKDTVSVYLPKGIRILDVSDDRVHMRVSLSSGDSDVYAKTHGKLVGAVPSIAGKQSVTITALPDGSVLFGEALLECSPARISLNVPYDGTGSAEINVTNIAAFNITGLSASINGSASAIATFSGPAPADVESGNTSTLGLQFDPGGVAGIYSGIARVDGGNGSSCFTELHVNAYNTSASGNASDTVPPFVQLWLACGTPMKLNVYADDSYAGGSAIMMCTYSTDGGSFSWMPPVDGAYDSPIEWSNASLAFSNSSVHLISLNCTDLRGNSRQVNINSTSCVDVNDTEAPLAIITGVVPFGKFNISDLTTEDEVEVIGSCNDTNNGGSYIAGADLLFDGHDTVYQMTPISGFFNTSTVAVHFIAPPMASGVHNVTIWCRDGTGKNGTNSSMFYVINRVDETGPLISDMEFDPSFITTIANVTILANATDIYTGNNSVIGCKWRRNSTAIVGTACSPDVNWTNVTGAFGAPTVEYNVSLGKLNVCNYTVETYCTDAKHNDGGARAVKFKVAQGDIMLVLDRSGSMADPIMSTFSYSNGTLASTTSTSYATVKTLAVNSSVSSGTLDLELSNNDNAFCYINYRAYAGSTQIASGSIIQPTGFEAYSVPISNMPTGSPTIRLELLAQGVPLQSAAYSNGKIFANDSSSGGSKQWTAPGNAASSNNAYATASLGNGVATHYLKATGFGFAIPATATINGIEANVERSASNSGSVRDYSVKLVKGGTVTGTSYADTSSSWSTTDIYKTYGGQTDLWGATFTPADINSANFGLAFSARQSGGGTRTARVDYVNITVYYAMPAQTCNATNRELTFSQTSQTATKIQAAKDAANSFVDLVDSSANVGMDSYSSQTASTKQLALMDSAGKSSLKSAINSLSASGSTCIWCGLNSGVDEIISVRGRYPNAARMIILMTDGQNNCIMSGSSIDCGTGDTYTEQDQDEMVDAAVYARDNNVTVYTIGFGSLSDIDPIELTNMALLTGGKYYYAPDANTLKYIYQHIGE